MTVWKKNKYGGAILYALGRWVKLQGLCLCLEVEQICEKSTDAGVKIIDEAGDVIVLVCYTDKHSCLPVALGGW